MVNKMNIKIKRDKVKGHVKVEFDFKNEKEFKEFRGDIDVMVRNHIEHDGGYFCSPYCSPYKKGKKIIKKEGE